MKIKELFDAWSLKGLKVNLHFLELDWIPADKEKDAAWEMYVELITRVTTQHLLPEDGDEESALKSLHSLFGTTRHIIIKHGRHCEVFARIAVVILNQRIRPFTAKWHRCLIEGELNTRESKQDFRDELSELQEVLRGYTGLLATVANVEDMTSLKDG